jgi:hypothetical protein
MDANFLAATAGSGQKALSARTFYVEPQKGHQKRGSESTGLKTGHYRQHEKYCKRF